ncbi:MAG TPA: glycosyltransferase, partial [Rhodothermales bacterium]
LLIAGEGNYRSELERLAGGATNIKFVGRVHHAALQKLYRGAIATVIPSLCYETFGIVAVESFSASTPVVAYAQSSLEEIVRTHGGGLLYRAADELKGHIRRLQTDKALRVRLAKEGRRAYETEFAEEPFVLNYLAVVRELLEQRHSKDPTHRATDVEKFLAGRPVFY